mgnify:CR=1 FL=1
MKSSKIYATIGSRSALRFETCVQTWGNSMGLRITRAVAELAGLEKGTPVTIERTPEGLLIRKRAQPPKVWTEAELLSGLTPYTAHADELPVLLPGEALD